MLYCDNFGNPPNRLRLGLTPFASTKMTKPRRPSKCL
ncbi:hypothetical protein CORC01_09531 [Colletotrichum orchidophilum]|uniref:Uncharacterized protein n=1 Tax=Colletotrichum orchidophilum TaxID=1209926 RepID=A0A1G4B173_9PEZI|nr:uncharacterized protein CORC01_09531 [Colletotrichum orchidophilum]OHE95144.1 hypothetical protein CORC01_09531 [Colletotrichum orchidophilum]